MDFLTVALETAVLEMGLGTLVFAPALAALVLFGLKSLVKETERRMLENPRGETEAWNRAFRMMGLGAGWRFRLSQREKSA